MVVRTRLSYSVPGMHAQTTCARTRRTEEYIPGSQHNTSNTSNKLKWDNN